MTSTLIYLVKAQSEIESVQSLEARSAPREEIIASLIHWKALEVEIQRLRASE